MREVSWGRVVPSASVLGCPAALSSCDSPVRGRRNLPGVADRHRGYERPQRVMRREDAVVAMPMFSGWWHKIGEPVEQLVGREVDDALLVAVVETDPHAGVDREAGVFP